MYTYRLPAHTRFDTTTATTTTTTTTTTCVYGLHVVCILLGLVKWQVTYHTWQFIIIFFTIFTITTCIFSYSFILSL